MNLAWCVSVALTTLIGTKAQCINTTPLTITADESKIEVDQQHAPLTLSVRVNRVNTSVIVTVEMGGVTETLLASSSPEVCESCFVHHVDPSNLMASTYEYLFRAEEIISNVTVATVVKVKVEDESDDKDTPLGSIVAISILFFIMIVGLVSLFVICFWKRKYDLSPERQKYSVTEDSTRESKVLTVA